MDLRMMVDADFAGDQRTRRSRSGYLTHMNTCLFSENLQRNDVLYSCATPKRGGFTCAHVQPDNESAPWYCKVRAKPPCNNTPMQIASNTPRVYVTLTATRSASFSLRTRSMFAEHRTSNALPSPSSQASIISTLLKIAETFSLVGPSSSSSSISISSVQAISTAKTKKLCHLISKKAENILQINILLNSFCSQPRSR